VQHNNAAQGPERKPASGTVQQLPVRAAPKMQNEKMQNEMTARKSRGRLPRETLEKLGKVLEGYYDDVRKQGVPDRFSELLRQFDERQDKGRHGEQDKGKEPN